MSITPEVFDWDRIESKKGFGSGYTKEEMTQLESMYSETLFVVEEKAVVKWLEDKGIKLVSKSSRFSVRDRVAFGRGSEKANDIGLNTQVNANARGYISN